MALPQRDVVVALGELLPVVAERRRTFSVAKLSTLSNVTDGPFPYG